ncbi:hypothetical protein CFK37_16700 [Virgibacillus phasianinus]|uniref:DUF421 domain-containing protein n=1 Tax=Virgibacillus phasianinus TaxID=2017483 RepID=A0A220U6G3_9BACI|nr:DUF421 domain-containing protein [Virgibacillus phasianinus]ASK63680.1 hypothetical protein CFK37_16700 [Virgibacillus phasianinus]
MFEQLDFFEMIFRATGAFVVLLIMTRIMGRKQLSQLTFFNYVTGIAIGSIAANIVSQSTIPFFNGLTSLIWWAILTIVVGYIGLKSPSARVTTNGQPIIVIKQGKILEDSIKEQRLTMDDLSMLLREQKVFSVQDVETAVLESNGKLSVMLKDEKQPVTKQDQNVFTVKPMYVPMELVVDGEVVEKNLKEAGISLDWLRNQLKSLKIKLDDVFYVELQKDGTLYIDKRSDDLPK